MIFFEAECETCGADLEIVNKSDYWGVKFGVKSCQSCLDHEYDQGKAEAEDDAYDSGYSDGLCEGKTIGYDNGYEYGYRHGQDEAKDYWYEEGKNDGYRECERDNGL